jgi:PPK2 family polyphosphate:nucleotide phosphotransferase
MPMLDSPYLVDPNKKFRLKDVHPGDTGPFKDKDEAADEVKKNLKRLDELQEVFYASAQRSLLVVFQAMDGGGKDGAIEHVFSGVNPQGCAVTSFKVPSAIEKGHDFLWRIHAAAPAKGLIGIFNRSHYESVLVERVEEIVPEKVWSRRYDHINAFEKMLADEGTVILKFFLHISKDEQKERMEARLADPQKNWKFNTGDLKTRAKWDSYMAAYEDLLGKCSTKSAPWFVVPADKKWFRNWVISDTIVRTLKGLHMKFPQPEAGLDKVVVK